MTRQALAGFIVINVVVSVAVAGLIILVWDRTQDDRQIIVTRPFPVVVDSGATSEPGALPGEAYQRTITALNNQGTSQANRLGTLENIAATAGFEQPTETPFVLSDPSADRIPSGVPTLDPTILGIVTLPPGVGSSSSSTQVEGAPPAPNDGCTRYIVELGDTCMVIADRFGVDTLTLIQLNQIDAECRTLREGQELRIPGPSCRLPPTPAPSPTITNTPFVIGTFAVTNTPAPTAEAAQIQIVQIVNPGDITREQVDIQNTGSEVIELGGWILSDSQDNIFTFPSLRMQPGQVIRIFSRFGQNTPGALYWNLTVPVWEAGDIATLFDAGGNAQTTFTVSGQTIDFGN